MMVYCALRICKQQELFCPLCEVFKPFFLWEEEMKKLVEMIKKYPAQL